MFARLADGNDARTRSIEGQATMLGRTMHAIVYDEIHDEIIVPQQFGQAILVFAGSASGEEPPLRFIQGPSTQLIAPDRLAVDPVHNEIFVPEGEKVLVFPREGAGDVAPIRVLTGPETRIGAARSVAVDPVRNLLVVAGSPPDARQDAESGRVLSQIAIFDRTAEGNTRPRAVIAGPKTGLTGVWNTQTYPDRGLIFVVQAGFVGVWSIADRGDVAPRYTIGGPEGTLRKPRGVVLDPENETVIVSDKGLNAVLTYHFPEVFSRDPTTP